MHLMEKIILTRLTKIINSLLKDLKILIFSLLKIGRIFPEKNDLNIFDWEIQFCWWLFIKLRFLKKVLYFQIICPILLRSVDNFDKMYEKIKMYVDQWSKLCTAGKNVLGPSFSRFWRNHHNFRNKRHLTWKPSWFSWG